eukprot:m.538966 g.538966  ORF g.538966 m.538966 type:complete len:101 (-) comp57631_c0_seq3:269-571(-)
MLFVSERLSFISSQTPAGLQSTRNDFAARSAPWNCLGVPREQALDRLQGGRTGTFVVRDGANFFGMLTLVLDGKLHQVPIEETEQGTFSILFAWCWFGIR